MGNPVLVRHTAAARGVEHQGRGRAAAVRLAGHCWRGLLSRARVTRHILCSARRSDTRAFCVRAAILADLFLYNTHEDVRALGSSVSQDGTVMAYGQNNFAFVTTNGNDITSATSATSLELLPQSAFGEANLDLEVSVRSGSVIIAERNELLVYTLLPRDTPETASWYFDGRLNATHVAEGRPIRIEGVAMGVDSFAVGGETLPMAGDVGGEAGPFVAIFERVEFATMCPGGANATQDAGARPTCSAAGSIPPPLNATAWQRAAFLRNADESWGTAVDLSGGFVAVGVPLNNSVQVLQRVPSGAPAGMAAWQPAYELVMTAATENGTVSGAERFGHSVSLRDELLVVGAPFANQFLQTQLGPKDKYSGGTNGGAIYLFRTPETVGSMDQQLLTQRICRVASMASNWHLGWSLAQDSMRDHTVVWAGAPQSNQAFVVLFTHSAERCEGWDRITGFRITSERDIGHSLSLAQETGYIGSPTASNSLLSSLATDGRLYVKYYCFPNRYAFRPDARSNLMECADCPAGRYSHGAGTFSGSCLACSTSQVPSNSEWIPGWGCKWRCQDGFFGPNCDPCSAYMLTEAGLAEAAERGDPLLPADAHWVDGAPTCYFECDVGFRFDNVTVECIPPPVPGDIRGVYAAAKSASTALATFVLPYIVPYSTFVSVRGDCVGDPLDGSPDTAVEFEAGFDVVRAATTAEAAALAVHLELAEADDPLEEAAAALPGETVSVLLRGLYALTDYTAQLRVANQGGYPTLVNATVSNHFETFAPTLPGVPLDLSTTDITGSSATLMWEPPIDSGGVPILRYDVCVRRAGADEDAECHTQTSAAASNHSVRIRRLTQQTTYLFEVSSVNSLGSGNWSSSLTFATVEASPPTAPFQPECDDSLATGSTVSLAWQEPEDLGGAAVSYSGVIVNTSADVDWFAGALPLSVALESVNGTAAAGQVSGTAGGLQSLKWYEFTVVASSVAGASPPSLPSARCFTGAATVPSPPSTPWVVSVTSSRGEWAWHEPTDFGGARLSQYELALYEVTDVVSGAMVVDRTVQVSAETTTVLVEGLQHSTTYMARVRARNSVGVSDYSEDALPATTLEAIPPTQPGAPVAVDATGGSLNISWTAPSDLGGAPVSFYSVSGSTSPIADTFRPLASVGGNQQWFLVGGLSANTAYFFRVAAANIAGLGPQSPRSNALTTSSPTQPRPPVMPTVSTTYSSTVSLLVLEPTDAGGVPVESYVVLIASGTAAAAAADYEGSATDSEFLQLFSSEILVDAPPPARSTSLSATQLSFEFNVTGLAALTSYAFAVRAKTSVGTSDLSPVSTPVSTLPPTVPSTPIPPQITCIGASSVVLHWGEVDDDGGDPDIQYRVLWYLAGAATPAGMLDVEDALSYRVSGLIHSSDYTFAIIARNIAGFGRTSAHSAVAHTRSLSAPLAPGRPVVAAVAATYAVVQWQATNLGGSPLVRYDVYGSIHSSSRYGPAADGADIKEGSAGLWTANITRLTPGSSLWVRVAAVTATHHSLPSEVSGEIVLPDIVLDAPPQGATVPGKPTAVALAAATPSMLSLTWTAPSESGGAGGLYYSVEVAPSNGDFEDPDARSVEVGEADVTHLDVLNLAGGSDYYVRVSATNAVGTGPSSDTVGPFSTDTVGQPGMVVPKLAFSPFTGAIFVAWDLPTETGGAAISDCTVGLEIRTDTDLYEDVSMDVTCGSCFSHLFSDLQVAATYRARTHCTNSASESSSVGFSAEVPTMDYSVPGAPQHVIANDITPGAVSLSWDAPGVQGGSDILDYWVRFVEYDPESGNYEPASDEISSGGHTFITITNLKGSTGYSFCVSAGNAQGIGDAAEQDGTVVTLPPVPPSAPGAPTVAATTDATGGSFVTIEFNVPDDAGGAELTSYVVIVEGDDGDAEGEGDGEGDGEGTVWSWQVSGFRATDALVEGSDGRLARLRVGGLRELREYAFQVAAINSAGQGEFSTQSDLISTGAADPPSRPVSVEVTSATWSTASLSWEPPLDDGGADVLGYTILAFMPPMDVRAEREGGVPLSSAAAEAEESYVLSTLDHPVLEFQVQSSARTAVATGLYAETPYYFVVVAFNHAGESQRNGSEPTSTFTLPAVVSGPPRDVRARADGSGAIEVMWSAPADFGGNMLECYELWVRLEANFDNSHSACEVQGFDARLGAAANNVSSRLVSGLPGPVISLGSTPSDGFNFTLSSDNAVIAPQSVVYQLHSCTTQTFVSIDVPPATGYRTLVRARTVRAPEVWLNDTLAGDAPNPADGRLHGKVSTASVVFSAARPPGRPTKPRTGSNFSIRRSSDRIDVDFYAPYDTGGCTLEWVEVVQSRIDVDPESNSTDRVVWTSDAPDPDEFFVVRFDNLTRFTRYEYTARAGNAMGASDDSTTLETYTLPAPPSPPLNLTVLNVSAISITLQWSPPLDNGGVDVQYYVLQGGPGGLSSAHIVESNVSSYVIGIVSGLTPDTEYSLSVAAVSQGVGPDGLLLPDTRGLFSVEVVARTDPPLPCPRGLDDLECSGAGHGSCHAWNGECTCDVKYKMPNCRDFDGVLGSLRLAGDLAEWDEGQLSTFLIDELSDIAGIDRERVIILKVFVGSIVVDFLILNPKPGVGSGQGSSASDVSAALTSLVESADFRLAALGLEAFGVGEEGSPAIPELLVVPDPRCEDHRSCEDCVYENSPCGWCQMTQACARGGAYGEAGRPQSSGCLWWINHDKEDDNTCPQRCSEITDCVSCTNRRDCTFCESTGECASQEPLSQLGPCPELAYNTGVTWMTAPSLCPVNRCPQRITNAPVGDPPCVACTRDLGCGYCSTDDLDYQGSCVAGNAFGIDIGAYGDDNAPAVCLPGRYRYMSCTAAYDCMQSPAMGCSECLSLGGSRCGYCVRPGAEIEKSTGAVDGQCVVASFERTPDGNSTGPLSGTCDDWRGNRLSCPVAEVTDTARCQAASSSCTQCLGTALREEKNQCGWCSSGGAASCMVNASNGGSPSNCAAFGTTQCVATCRDTVFIQDLSGSVRLGSAGLGLGVVREVYAGSSECSWILTPMQVVDAGISTTGTTATTMPIRYPIVEAAFSAVDLGPGDVIRVYDGPASATTLLLTLTQADNIYLPIGDEGPSVTTETGYMLIEFHSDGEGTGTGFYLSFDSSRQSVFDIFMISAIVIAAVCACLCLLCICNRACARPEDDDEMGEDEGLEMATERAQRTGRGARKETIDVFPEFIYDELKHKNTPWAMKESEDLQCIICLTEYEDGDKIRLLACNHSFHVPCIDQWLQLNRVCPLCKRDINVMAGERISLLESGVQDALAESIRPVIESPPGATAVAGESGGGGGGGGSVVQMPGSVPSAGDRTPQASERGTLTRTNSGTHGALNPVHHATTSGLDAYRAPSSRLANSRRTGGRAGGGSGPAASRRGQLAAGGSSSGSAHPKR